MSADALEIVELNGVRIVLDPAYLSPKLRKRIRAGRLSQPEAEIAARLVERGERFVELGGGIGYTSSLVAKRGLAESVTTFEPNPDVIPAMKRTHAMNGVRAAVLNAVVVARKESDTIPFFVSEHFNASSLSGRAQAQKRVDVPVMSFAEMKERFSPTMLLIDIEGAELDLFHDIDLGGVRKVLVELHKRSYGEAGLQRIDRFFAASGFARDPRFSRGQVVLFRRLGPVGRVRWKLLGVWGRGRKFLRSAGRALRRRGAGKDPR